MPPETAPDTDDALVAEESFSLRPGGVEDLDAVLEVFRAASGGPGQIAERRTPDQVAAWCRSLLDLPGRELWLAERDTGSGAVLLGFLLLEGEWVNLVFVHPDRPARGVGAALFDLVRGLRPEGFGLRVHQGNDRARAFYRRQGLVELEHTDGRGYADGEPDLQMAWLGQDPTAYLRRRIDAVDDELAVLLARRAALTAAVQDQKRAAGDPGGEQGRDAEREEQIVDRMARQVPDLDRQQVRRVMHTVIEESLAAWERRQGRTGSTGPTG